MTHETYLASKVTGSNFKENDISVEGYSSEYGKQFVNLIKVTREPKINKDFFVCEKELVNNYFKEIKNT